MLHFFREDGGRIPPKYSATRILRDGDIHLLRLPFTANVPSWPFLVTLMVQAIHSSETSVITRATESNSPEDGILHCHHYKNLKSLTYNIYE
jgi:hypothetical protein